MGINPTVRISCLDSKVPFGNVEIVLLVFTIPTYWDGDNCSEDAELVLYSARDGVHLKSQNEPCLQDS
jgi:hypothetical protein